MGADGKGGPTTEPCGVCDPCRAITEGRHVDVLEMDAASRTGVGDIREIIESVYYRAASARYKVYVIDEVHMLSTAAFNALLKTLEEPPAHVKFIFATTEIRKVPVTVLSRCQRFDLRRIEPEVMIDHLTRITMAEGAAVAQDALALITRAAEGSVRDAMSLLDQAIAQGVGETTAAEVRAMLGLADRSRVLDLFDLILQGNAAAALQELGAQYANGADPMSVLRDLAEISHWLSVIKIAPDAADDPTTPPAERDRGRDMAARLPQRVLGRTWQMLLKAIEEVPLAPNAMMAAEMAVIRLTHVSDLPDPATLIRKLQSSAPPPVATQTAPVGNGAGSPRAMASAAPRQTSTGGPAKALATLVDPLGLPQPQSFADVLELIRARRDLKLLHEVENGLRLVHFAPGRIEFEPGPAAPTDMAARLGQQLSSWTGTRWGVSVVGTGGGPTFAEQRQAELRAVTDEAAEIPLVAAVMAAFPGARITEIRTPDVRIDQARDAALPEVDDEWDPFEDD